MKAKKLCSKNIYNEYSPPNTLGVIKSRKIKCMSVHPICDTDEINKKGTQNLGSKSS
jgi:hypothetical protein